jgi:hypothetical protein
VAGHELATLADTLTILAPGVNGKVHYRDWSVSKNAPYASGWTPINAFTTTVAVAARRIEAVPDIPWKQLVVVGRGNDRKLYTARGTCRWLVEV